MGKVHPPGRLEADHRNEKDGKLELRKPPPKKRPGQARGRRRIDGAVMDIVAGAGFLGISDKALRGRVSRRQIPFRRLNGRIVFRTRDLEAWLDALPGVTVEEALENLRGSNA